MHFILKPTDLSSTSLCHGRTKIIIAIHDLKKNPPFMPYYFEEISRVSEEVLHQAGIKKKLVDTVQKHKLTFLGHIIRQEGIQREKLEGTVSGERQRKSKNHMKRQHQGMVRGKQKTKYEDLNDGVPVAWCS